MCIRDSLLSDVINPEEGAEIDYQRMAELKSEIARLEEGMDALHDAACNSPVTEDHLAKVIELWSGCLLYTSICL